MSMATAKETILERIKSIRETIAVGRYSEEMAFERVGKMFANCVKPAEFRSQEVFRAVMAEVVEFAQKPDFKAIETAVKEDAAAPEEFAKALERLKVDVTLFQEYYVPYLDTLDVFGPVIISRNELFDVLGDLYTTGELKDAKRLFYALAQFVTANMAMCEDVYREDIADKTMELPSFDDDAPMTWPAPCDSELNGALPSWEEVDEENCVFGEDWPTTLDPIIPHTEGEIDPVLMKDWVARLWGKASRLAGGRLISNHIRVQVPRLVMYPFYDEFFRFACRFALAIEDYRSGKLGPLRGSVIIKEIDGVHLPWFMEKLLLFAPREYFKPECNHYGYMMLCSAILTETLKNLCTAVTKIDTRDIARDACAVKDAYKRFFNFLCADHPPCTRREYAAQAKEIVDAFKAAYIRLADGLAALECEMEKAKPAPNKSREGIKHETFATPVWQAAEWAGVGEATIRRYWKNPKKGMPRPPLMVAGTEEARKGAFEEWGKLMSGVNAAKHEANMKNHAVPTGRTE